MEACHTFPEVPKVLRPIVPPRLHKPSAINTTQYTLNTKHYTRGKTSGFGTFPEVPKVLRPIVPMLPLVKRESIDYKTKTKRESINYTTTW